MDKRYISINFMSELLSNGFTVPKHTDIFLIPISSSVSKADYWNSGDDHRLV